MTTLQNFQCDRSPRYAYGLHVVCKVELIEIQKFKALPIRSPPISKQNTFFSEQPTYMYRPFSALLTPVESSDDDLDESILEFETDQLPPLDDSNGSSGSSASSIKVIVGDDGDADMEMGDSRPRLQFSSPQPWQRQRSNDMLSPPRLPHLLDTTHRVGNERIPTPIYGHFSSNDVNMGTAGGTGPSMSLSPLIREEEESHWWRGRRLPSPVEHVDEHMSSVSQADGMMGRLNVNNLNNIDAVQPHSSVLNGTSLWPPVIEQQTGRFASEAGAHRAGRLTMGFRADCDKCARRVPGHYSHIVRD